MLIIAMKKIVPVGGELGWWC